LKRILLVADPIGGSTSVQFQFLLALAHDLRPLYRVAIFAPYCADRRARDLRAAGVALLTPGGTGFFGERVLSRLGSSNESMLWAESWVREALFDSNQIEISEILSHERFDYVVNLSMTTPVPCDVWWIQGAPLHLTIHGMASTNIVARLTDMFGSRMVEVTDRRIIEVIQRLSKSIVANSPFLADFYRSRGVPVRGVIYSLPDFSAFHPCEGVASRDYALIYIGKETDSINLEPLWEAGVRVVGFGGKIPAYTRIDRFRRWIDFRGHVSQADLVRLYSNAMFTLFPFTWEPLGCVPLESMACGTPVLTYSRQGPASTVVAGRTGWLVNNSDEMVAKAVEIWKSGETGLSIDDCVRQARMFALNRPASSLIDQFEGVPRQ